MNKDPKTQLFVKSIYESVLFNTLDALGFIIKWVLFFPVYFIYRSISNFINYTKYDFKYFYERNFIISDNIFMSLWEYLKYHTRSCFKNNYKKHIDTVYNHWPWDYNTQLTEYTFLMLKEYIEDSDGGFYSRYWGFEKDYKTPNDFYAKEHAKAGKTLLACYDYIVKGRNKLRESYINNPKQNLSKAFKRYLKKKYKTDKERIKTDLKYFNKTLSIYLRAPKNQFNLMFLEDYIDCVMEEHDKSILIKIIKHKQYLLG